MCRPVSGGRRAENIGEFIARGDPGFGESIGREITRESDSAHTKSFIARGDPGFGESIGREITRESDSAHTKSAIVYAKSRGLKPKDPPVRRELSRRLRKRDGICDT
jgi:hypothetical protein